MVAKLKSAIVQNNEITEFDFAKLDDEASRTALRNPEVREALDRVARNQTGHPISQTIVTTAGCAQLESAAHLPGARLSIRGDIGGDFALRNLPETVKSVSVHLTAASTIRVDREVEFIPDASSPAEAVTASRVSFGKVQRPLGDQPAPRAEEPPVDSKSAPPAGGPLRLPVDGKSLPALPSSRVVRVATPRPKEEPRSSADLMRYTIFEHGDHSGDRPLGELVVADDGRLRPRIDPDSPHAASFARALGDVANEKSLLQRYEEPSGSRIVMKSRKVAPGEPTYPAAVMDAMGLRGYRFVRID